ncbi:conserved Plasmodium membrane protein, unknown function [Plasmodium knowlesi strain H]|uniref:Transmembrane protein n=3 Tax=Plasmodium knowlesi TaxID=5850 RepID=A0A1A7VVB3_PLAKH|nr:uncharacterized protein PKNH_1402600 [Plasmodium knowlesi strain H]OTN64282.1 Uncharacterized protein PKNOH_S140219700 [Plasmodium knowlesi]CAA9990625.1 conserved protein, unknown function [Plasmodium knowlesi strain H]SBO26035.1 conserved Plasmodium membrane protein, unknown function [Plasmodium knowlesi strain H]SBO28733.1 conserved Plasmodium membrane protein, unknown function [Plasmodium knowlesi strain H]VVS80099.1 conserved protein, unknown function [Plasmodium knowlesi strain H]
MEHVHRTALTETEDDLRIENQNFLGEAETVVRLVIVFVDILLIASLALDLNVNCDGYLRTWIIGAILLSFFLFSFVRRVQVLLKEDKGLFSEVLLMLVCFLWTYFGTIQINKASSCQKSAPYLFWTVFTLVTTIWCSIIGLILSLMIITIGSFFVVRSKVG